MRRRSSTPIIAAPSQARVQRLSHQKMHPNLWRMHLPFTILMLLLSAFLLQMSAHSQTTSTGTATAVPGRAPGKVVPRGLKAGVVAATDTSGDLEMATRALAIANAALSRSPGYTVVPPRDVAGSLSKANIRWPFTTTDYQTLRKSLKIDRALAVAVTPGTLNDTSAAYSAVVELYDTTTGGLVGRGEGNSTVTPPPAPVVTDVAPAADGTTVVPIAPPAVAETDWQMRAVDAAVINAIEAMNQPATLTGVVVARPDGYRARLSLGEIHGIRNGARIEYLVNGLPVAYGTVIDLGRGESLATIAPEAAAPAVFNNMQVRTATNPPLGLAGPTGAQLDEKEWRRFEREFGIAAAIAGAAYLIFR